jgi:DNA-binding MarR family transcriptional regulator
MENTGLPTDNPPPGALAIEAATALLVTVPWVQRVADEAVRVAGTLSAPKVRMLLVLTEGSRRGSEIAARWHVTRAAVAESAASLSREGYIRRVPDPDDGRAVRFSLTPKGRRAMEKFGIATTTALARHVERLPPAQQQVLLDTARDLLTILTGSKP